MYGVSNTNATIPQPIHLPFISLQMSSSRPRRLIQCRHIPLPPLLIHPYNPSVVCHQPVDLALNVARLGVNGPGAGIPHDLVPQLGQQLVCAVMVRRRAGVVQLVGLVDGRDGVGKGPEARLVNLRIQDGVHSGAEKQRETHFSSAGLNPIPPNSPCTAILLPSYGVDGSDDHGVPHCASA